MGIEKLSETQIAIIDEISRAFDRLGAERGIFAALHSWGDTMSDLEVLQMLKEQNQMMTTSSIPLQRELEPSAEELLRLVMDNFFVNHKGGNEWGINEGYPLAEVVGATMERNLAKYLPEKSVIKYNEKNGLKTDSDDNSKRKNR